MKFLIGIILLGVGIIIAIPLYFLFGSKGAEYAVKPADFVLN